MMTRLVVAVSLITLAPGTAPARDPEPEYGGKPLSAWSDALTRKGATKAERRDAAWALYMIGAKAAPALVAALGSAEDSVRGDASLVLVLLGTDAVPELAKALKSKNKTLQTYSWIVLTRMGPKAEGAVPTLIELLGAKDGSAMNVLATLGPAAKDALPALAKILADTDRAAWKNPPASPPDREPCDWAGGTLARLGVTGAPTLIEALKHSDAGVRRKAIYYLGAVLATRLDESPGERARRLAITDWLRGTGADAKAAREILAKALSDPEAYVRHGAAEVLATCGPAAKDAVPALVAALEDVKRNTLDEPTSDAPRGWLNVRKVAAEALGYIGPEAKAAVPALAKALSDSDGRVGEAAAFALHALGEVAHPASDALLEASKSENVHVAGTASMALERIAHKVPALAKPLTDPNETPARRLEAALRIGGKDVRTAPILVAALKTDPDPKIRQSAASKLRTFVYDPIEPNRVAYRGMTEYPWFWLGRWGKVERARARRIPDKLPAEIVPALVEALGDKNPSVRTAATDTLAIIGAEAKTAVPALLKIIEERAGEERAAAIVALWAMGADAKTVVPVLEDAVGDAAVRSEALIALARIDPSPKRAVALVAPDGRFPSGELIALGAHAKEVVPKLVGSFQGREPDDLPENLAAATLIRLGEHAVPGLIEGLKSSHANVRYGAVWSLGRIDPKAKDAIEPLAAALRDEELAVRVAAAKALLLIDSQAARKLGLR